LSIQYAGAKKDTPIAVLNGSTLREALIDLSERYVREKYGDDILARWLIYRVLRLNPLPEYVIIDGAGMIDEIECVSPRIVVRVDRPGRDFSKDSRTYIDNPDYAIDNNGDKNALLQKAAEIAIQILGKKRTA